MTTLLRVALIATLSLTLAPSSAHAQRPTVASLQNRVDSLERRTAELERRVADLEALLRADAPQSKSATASPNSRDIANWRRLRHKMTMSAVRALLGEPESVNAGAVFTTWSYPDFGSVTFANGRLDGWSEPRRF